MMLDSFAELYVGRTANAIWILMGAVAAVLLITCANVGNMFLVRALRRRGEMALRAALGATESRIMRLGVAEAIVIASAAGVVGVLLAIWGANVLVALAPVRLPRAGAIAVDWRVVGFAIGISLIASVVVSLVAAWPAVHGGLWRALGRGSRTTTGQRRLQEALLSGQTALSTILLAATGLLFTTWSNLRQVDPGFDPDALVAVQLPIRPPTYDTSERLDQFAQGVIEGVRTSGGIDFVAGASSLPFERGLNFPISIAGRDEFGGSVELRTVTQRYFRTLAIPVVRGRSFTAADVWGAAPVAIVNGSTLPAERLERAFTQAIRAVDPALPGPDVSALSETVADALARERFGTLLVSLFGALALILTAVGVYRVVAQTVRNRHREIGIRMAVGANGNQVLRSVVMRGLLPIAIGIGIGLVGAAALSGLLEAYLWGVAGTDTKTLGVAAAGILAVAIVACWIPAREAAEVDPVTALAS